MPAGLPSMAFQMRHIARSLDRLLTYAEERQLTPEQAGAMKTESAPHAAREALFQEFASAIASAVRRVMALQGADLEAQRFVGRQMLPTTLGGLVVHLADHTQRHVGQAVTTSKVLHGLKHG